jgi:hypothetical protein
MLPSSALSRPRIYWNVTVFSDGSRKGYMNLPTCERFQKVPKEFLK